MQRSRMMTALIAALAVVGFAPALAGAQVTGAVAPATIADPLLDLTEPGDSVRLSDEVRVTRWAHASEVHPIRVLPSSAAPVITRLRFLTEDKFPEVYLVLEAKVDAAGDQWLHIRVPMRPNGRTGWVPADMMGPLNMVRTRLVIDRRAKRATLYRTGRRIWQAPVGIGKSSTPTPQGKFYVREVLKGDGKAYGNWAIGTSAYSNISDWPNGGVVGIHGTNQPQLIPGRPSHGCVRVRNAKMSALKRLMPIGTPVDIVR